MDTPPEQFAAAKLSLQDCSGPGQLGDADIDGVCGNVDNCPSDYNPSQADANADGIGDACTPICINLQRGVSGTLADAGIRSANPSTNYGTATQIVAGYVGTGPVYALLSADLSAVPTGAVVTSSTLTVAVTATTAATLSAHRITAPWSEATVSWTSFASAFDVAAQSSAGNASPSNNTPVTFDLKPLTQAWVSGASPNYGVLLEQPGSSSTKIATGESAGANIRPKLAVCYTVPEAPSGCAVNPDGTPCDDGDACSTNDVCSAGVCAGTTVSCSDENACTSDACDPATGACVFTSTTGACDDGDACTTGDTCQAGACVGAGQPDVDGDGSCGGFDNCPTVYNPSQLDSNSDGVGDACTPICTTTQRGVSGTFVDSGVRSSNPGNTYGTATQVLAGFQTSGPAYALMQASLGAIPTNAIVTSSNLVVTSTATASATINAHRITAPWSEAAVSYNSFASAFDAAIAASTGNAAPSNNTPITFDVKALAQAWVSGSVPNYGILLEQPGANNTKLGTSEAAGAPNRPSLSICYVVPEVPVNCAVSPNGTPCNDGNSCTTGDVCASGACGGAPASCDDGNTCTTDSCNPGAGGCSHVNNALSCDDGDACTSGDVCSAGVCAGVGQGDSDGDGLCGPSDNCPNAFNPSQADANGDGVGDACTLNCMSAQRGVGAAVADTGVRFASPTSAFGTANQVVVGFFSTGPSYALIDADLSSIPVGSLVTSSALTVAVTATTSATIGAHRVTVPWSETTTTWNTFGSAFSATPSASAGNASPSTNTPVGFDLTTLTQAWIDGTVPNYGVALVQAGGANTKVATSESGGAAVRPVMSVCYTVPELATGCSAPGSDGTSCDDGNACTQNDVCSAGVCGGTTVSCNDGNACTTDSCSPQTGCSNVNIAQACDDGNACTQNDACVNGVCTGGFALSCDDGNPCTDDSCDPATACVYVNNTSPCNDGNECTGGDVCSGGLCAGASLPDGDADGVCDAADNCPVDPNPTQTDGNANGLGDVCDDGCNTVSLATEVDLALAATVGCNQALLVSPGAPCTSSPAPSCADTLIGDATRLAYGVNDPPVSSVNAGALASPLSCQDAIGTATHDYVAAKLQSLVGGATATQSDAAAAPALDVILTSCAGVTVAQDASGVVLPAVGVQCAAAVGAPGSVVNATDLHRCLGTLLTLWVDRIGPTPAALRPNIVFILADDQRMDTTGPTHSMTSANVMPGLHHELGDSGVELTNAFLTTPLCGPSRAAIMKGQYAHNTGVHQNAAPNGTEVFNDASTLAVWLKSAGYRTGLVGKYINGYENLWAQGAPPYMPPGWDDWHAFKQAGYYNYQLVENGVVNGYGNTAAAYSTDVLRERAKTFIAQSAGGPQPFFLWLGIYAPHLPLVPAPRHVGLYASLAPWAAANFNEADVSDKPSWIQGIAPMSAALQANHQATRMTMLEMLQATDEAIAGSATYGITGVMETLRSYNVADNTIVIYMADNGWAWGEHRLNGKTRVYEEQIRTPMFIRYPKLAPLARKESRMALNIDIAATLMELAGGKAGLPTDGRSLVRVLDGTAPSWRSDFLVEGYNAPAGIEYACVREERWKYNELAYGDAELYDTLTDPMELQSVVHDPAQASRVATMAARLRQLRPAWPNDVP